MYNNYINLNKINIMSRTKREMERLGYFEQSSLHEKFNSSMEYDEYMYHKQLQETKV